MKIKSKNNEIVLNSKEINANFVLKSIEDLINNESDHFSHLIINEIEVYDKFDKHIKENIELIEEISIIFKTEEEFIKEIFNTINSYFARAIPEISSLSEKFYSTPSKNDWVKLSQLFEGFQYIVNSYKTIDSSKKLNKVNLNYESWLSYSKEILKLNDFIKEIDEALNNQDYILIGDILNYEITSIFEDLKKIISKLFD